MLWHRMVARALGLACRLSALFPTSQTPPCPLAEGREGVVLYSELWEAGALSSLESERN